MNIVIKKVEKNPNFPDAFIGEPKINDCFRHFFYTRLFKKAKEQGVLKVIAPITYVDNDYCSAEVIVEYCGLINMTAVRPKEIYLADYGMIPYHGMTWNSANYLTPISLEEYTKIMMKTISSEPTIDYRPTTTSNEWVRLENISDFRISDYHTDILRRIVSS